MARGPRKARHVLLVVALTLSFVAGAATERWSERGATQLATTHAPRSCPLAAGDVATADALMADRYTFSPHPTAVLSEDIRWNVDPFHDRNWQFQLHSLRWTESLWTAWEQKSVEAYRARYIDVLRDWYEDNPRAHPASAFSWNDHAAAWRGIVYACALKRLVPRPQWLAAAARVHGVTLSDEGFYQKHGNHALNQALGLLELGCSYPNASWRDLAARRINTLALESIDAYGVTNEQSDGYHSYNHGLYRRAIARLDACGLAPSATMARRVALMPRFASFASAAGGRTVMIGDTQDGSVMVVPGTETDYVRSGGVSGRRPASSWFTFGAGYAFFRSGWGSAARPLAYETSVGVRFGPPRRFHGHFDATSVVLSSYGDRILLDAGGPHDYNGSAWEGFFRSEAAHNTVLVDGVPLSGAGWTHLRGQRHTGRLDFVAIRRGPVSGITHDRRVFYSKTLDVLIVEDQLTATRARTFRQLWHLQPNAAPSWYGASGGFVTRRPDGPDVRVRQLVGGKERRIIRGARSPLQGWLTFRYGRHVAAPVVESSDHGRTVRYVTVIIPSADGGRSISVRRFALRPYGFDLAIAAGGLTERIVVGDISASEVSI